MNAPALPFDLGPGELPPPSAGPRGQEPLPADEGDPAGIRCAGPHLAGPRLAAPHLAGPDPTGSGVPGGPSDSSPAGWVTPGYRPAGPGPAGPAGCGTAATPAGPAGASPETRRPSDPMPGPVSSQPPGPGVAGRSGYPPARLAARRFVDACLEVVGGFRPVTHLRALCRPDRFALIAERLTGRTATTPAGSAVGGAHFGARTPVMGRFGTGRPPRSGRAGQSAPGDRIVVRRIRLGEPLPGVAEVAVVLLRRERAWAMALRLEHRSGRWLCAHLEVL